MRKSADGDKGEAHGISKEPRSCKRDVHARTTRATWMRESERTGKGRVEGWAKRMYVVLREGA